MIFIYSHHSNSCINITLWQKLYLCTCKLPSNIVLYRYYPFSATKEVHTIDVKKDQLSQDETKKIFFVCAPNSYFSLKELPVTSIKNVRLIPKWKGNQASFFLFSLLTLYVSVVSCKKMLQWNARLFKLERYKILPR